MTDELIDVLSSSIKQIKIIDVEKLKIGRQTEKQTEEEVNKPMNKQIEQHVKSKRNRHSQLKTEETPTSLKEYTESYENFFVVRSQHGDNFIEAVLNCIDIQFRNSSANMKKRKVSDFRKSLTPSVNDFLTNNPGLRKKFGKKNKIHDELANLRKPCNNTKIYRYISSILNINIYIVSDENTLEFYLSEVQVTSKYKPSILLCHTNDTFHAILHEKTGILTFSEGFDVLNKLYSRAELIKQQEHQLLCLTKMTVEKLRKQASEFNIEIKKVSEITGKLIFKRKGELIYNLQEQIVKNI